MTLALYDRVQETTTTSGTGSVTLAGAVSGYQSFAVVGNGNTCYYTIVNNAAWEVGIGTYSTTGPTLARTTVLSNSNGNTSPITLSGSSSVFLTYPAEKSVNLDASGNVSPLGTVSSGTWHGSTVGVAYGGTGVTASTGANSVVLRDSYENITTNNINLSFQQVVTSGGTTALTVASPYYTQFTGTSTQILQLPDATTCILGTTFIFDNDSTQDVTIKDGAGSTFELLVPGGFHTFVLESNSTVAGSWLRYSQVPSAVEWGTLSLNLGATVVSGGTWQGGTIAGGYGGTGLTSFVAANNALYSTGATTLTAGTLPVAAGGTGRTSLTSGYIPYGNGTSGYNSSSSLQFNGTYLVVGGTTPLSGATNPITAFSSTANNYVQTYTYNANNGTSASADFVAYADNSTDAHGWADMGFTSSTYADPTYTITGPNEAYILGSAPSGAGATGNLVYATDSTGSANAHQWYVGGFTQLKSAYKMQLDSTGLQVAGNAVVGSGLANNVTIAGASTGNSTSISATGSDTNISIAITPKGSGSVTTAATLSAAGLTDSGNLTFTGTGNRITGDMSNATVSNAVHFQSSTTNGATRVGALPNGTSTTSSFRVNNSSDLTNTATGAMVIDSGSFYLATSNSGTGSILPINFYTGGTQQQFAITHTANTANYLQVTGAATTASPTISAAGSDTNISITLTPKGTGNIVAGAGAFSGSGSALTSLNASNLASGTVPTARLASGTASSSTYLRGDQTWATISAGSPGGSTTQVQYNSAGSFAGSANLTFDGTNLTCGGTVTANSDESLKTNWRDLPADFVAQLAKVKHGTYDRVDLELTQDGVSAQSLQSLLPNSVLKGEDGKLSVAYGNAALVAAIKLAERVVELEARLAALEK